ncbi:DUF1624 domain-containing protein [Larkinella rosea]|uniref:DUF1624 domain-containing protein n=1 Tax=Larkinella rosea TaxID=2025312 RepID=A0A3P1BVI7_9BACT|nr:heparan-alpha-glucosaminide N-acetyltransferase domain-containing protein [Larkinella rosea]RRB04604.1 DUF1624 domain-containing protein [Larkinella rosea]
MSNLTATSEGSHRLQSIDSVRGLIMIIMALDHVRDFFSYTSYRATDVTQASVFLFFTRWVTHMCAPTFVFLSGISIFLYYRKMGDLKKTSVFLLTRGLWLIAVEVLLISFILTQGYQLTLLEVIWAIGCSMMLLAALIWLPRGLQLAFSLLLIVGHNALPLVKDTSTDTLLALLHHPPFFIRNPPILVAYTIVPWVGVMLLGYAIGPWFSGTPQTRNQLLLKSGFSALALFIVVRFLNFYGDPAPWSVQERGSLYTFLSFLNVTKSPPSLLFLSLTLGTASLLLVFVNNLSAGVQRFFSTYGRVPFFYFIVHLAVISLASYVWTYVAFGRGINLSFTNPNEWPTDYNPNLGRAYGVWLLLVGVLYFPCRWYARYKSTSRAWWVSYL